MFCCLLELKCSEENLSEREIEQSKETIKSHLDFTDHFAAATCRQILLFTPVKTYDEVKKKLACIQENFEKKHGPSIRLNCGFAEIKCGDVFGAVDGAKQMLARTTENNRISGMYYYRFMEI